MKEQTHIQASEKLRYKSEVLGNLLRITIPSSKNWSKHTVMLAIFGLTPLVLIMLFRQGGVAVLIQILCLGWWALVVIWIMYNFLWEMVGKEEIELSPDEIKIHETIFGIGWPPRVYAVGEISRIRVDASGRVGPYAPNDEGGISISKGTGMIAFDWQGKHTDRMGICLTEAEANELVATIQRQYPQFMRT